MASQPPSSSSSAQTLVIVLLSFLLVSSLQLSRVSSFEFQVGDNIGWVVPPANHTGFYNDWASKKRFQVGDTLRFKYRKDSVMEVNETDYRQCSSRRPSFFSNTGNTVLSLDRSGYFYFISGASGHCDKGQRMILKVIADEYDDHNSSPSSSAASPSHGLGSLHHHHQLLFAIPTFLHLILLLFLHGLASHVF